MWWNKYIDFKFEEKGRNEKSGDCWGLLYQIYKNELGITVPDYLDFYATTQDREVLAELIKKEKQSWVSVSEPKEFDVVIVTMRGVPMHIGIVTKKGYMIHCAKGVDTSHERYDGVRWRNKIVGFERHSSLR